MDQMAETPSDAQPASIEEALRLLRPLGRDSVSGRAWAMVAAERERLRAIEQRARDQAAMSGTVNVRAQTVAAYILGEAESR